jgi:hypothetical protein
VSIRIPDNASSGQVNNGPTSDGWGCAFDTQGNQINDLLVDIAMSQHEMQFFTLGLQLGPISGLGAMAYVQRTQYGATVYVLAKNALLKVAESDGPVTADQLEAIAEKIYARLASR